MWHLYGCNSSYVQITPTRTAIGAGKANGPLDTSGMPTITLNAGVEFGIPVNYIHVDGIYFTGSSTDSFGMIGTSTGDYQSYTNCVFLNAGNGGNSRALATDKYSLIYNCDAFATGANAATRSFHMGTEARIINCRGTNISTDTTSSVFAIGLGTVVNCLAYDSPGVGVYLYNSNSFPSQIVGCSFKGLGTAIKFHTTATVYPTVIVGNIARSCTNFIDNPAASDVLVSALYNHLNNNTTDYPADVIGVLGFQDLTTDPLFVNEGTDDYNLQSGSPAKNSGAFLTNRGAMSDVEAGAGGGGGGVVGVGWN